MAHNYDVTKKPEFLPYRVHSAAGGIDEAVHQLNEALPEIRRWGKGEYEDEAELLIRKFRASLFEIYSEAESLELKLLQLWNKLNPEFPIETREAL